MLVKFEQNRSVQILSFLTKKPDLKKKNIFDMFDNALTPFWKRFL